MPFGKLPVWMAFLELEDIHESAQPCDFFFFSESLWKDLSNVQPAEEDVRTH